MYDQLLSLNEKPYIPINLSGTGIKKSVNMKIRNLIMPILFTISVFLVSCSGKEEKPDRSGLIPEKDLVPILTEIHIADGLLPNPKIQKWMISVDSISTYYYIIEKHGYTKESFDNTMRYYFISKPKKLISIYDRILGNLSEMESLLEKEVKLARDHTSDVWPGERNYYFPDTSATQSVGFELSLSGSLFYTLKFTATLFPDDQSVSPRAIAFICDADSILTGTRKHFKTLDFIKDGQPHTYTIRLPSPPNKTIQVKGTLYETDNYLEELQKHVMFEDITLTIFGAEI